MPKRTSGRDSKGQESLQQSLNSEDLPSGHETGRLAGDVTALSSDGRGIVRAKEQVYFAERVVPGDRVAFTPDLSAKPAAAREVKVLRRSEDRCGHPCRHAKQCPASGWGIVSYARQLKEKTELVRRVLRGVVPVELVRDILPSPQEWGYRNRVTLRLAARPRGGFEIGYAKSARASELVGLTTCLLASEVLQAALEEVAEQLIAERELPAEVIPTRLTLFETANGVGALAVYSGRPRETDVQLFLELAERWGLRGGIWVTGGTQAGLVGERGTYWRTEECRSMQVDWLGHALEVHPAGFAQANSGAAALVLEVMQKQRETFAARKVWDLYGGYGALGFAAAQSGSEVIVVEQSRFSQSTFDQLALMNPELSARFEQGEATKALVGLKSELGRDDLVILDPPRAGCHPEALALLAKSRIRRIAYLSCNPARLSRDLKLLAPAGFQATRVQPVDFFPQTPEIEALALVERS